MTRPDRPRTGRVLRGAVVAGAGLGLLSALRRRRRGVVPATAVVVAPPTPTAPVQPAGRARTVDLARVATVAARGTVVTGAVLGLLAVVLGVVCLVAGARPMIFRSGSMAPAIDAGSLAFTRHADAASLRVGDVVTVPVDGTRVTHRVIALDRHGDVALLQLKGDANRAADRTIYPVREVQRTWFSMPYAGSLVSWLSGPLGSIVLAAYLLFAIAVLSAWSRATGRRTPAVVLTGALRTRALALSTAVMTLAGAGMGGWALPTWASWTDNANASGSTIATGTWDVAAPSSSITGITPVANAAGWYNANITVTLTATDPAPSSGVAGIHYKLNGGTEQVLAGATGTVPITTEGTNTLDYWAVDNAGFIESPHHTATFKLDKTPPPAPAFTSISSDTGSSSTDLITSAATQTLSGTAEANSTVTVKQGTFVLGTTTADATGHFTYGPVTLAPGANGFTATAKDVADNISPSSANFVVTLDAVAPNSVVIAPNDNLWHNTGTWTITASDALSGVSSITYKVGAGSPTTAAASNGVAFSPPTLSDGTNSVQAYATDVAGNPSSASPTTANIKVDTVKPIATLNLAAISNAPWRISGAANVTAIDATSGVEHVEYKIDSGSFVSLASGVGFTIPDGTHTITYRAVDFAGNVSSDASQAVQIDSVKPTTTVASSQTPNAAGWISANTTLTFSPTDPSPASGVANVQFQTNVNGAGFGAYTTLSSTPYTTSVTTEGTTVVGFRANDVAGNTEAPDKTYTVKLDKTAPGVGSIVFSGTLSGGWLNSGAFTISGNDAGTVGIASGVNHYEYAIDGGSFVSGSTGTVPDGSHTVSYRTVDNAGNLGAIATTATTKVDSVAPVLSNPLPANGASDSTWTALSCSASSNQLCVNATDGGSGIQAGSVTVTLSATSGANSGKCWAGGTSWTVACTPQAMSVLSGSQYGTSGLTNTAMPAGSYTATFNAKDVAGNTATPVVASFSVVAAVPAAPVITCGTVGKKFVNINWSAVSGATSYDVYAPNGSTLKANVTATTYQLTTVNEAGTVRVVAKNSSGQSVASNVLNYDVNNGSNSGTCS